MCARPRRTLDSLEVLNGKSRSSAFKLSDLAWDIPVDRSKNWMPEKAGALGFLPSYALLDPVEQRRCNQLYAIGLSEHFIWLEAFVTKPALKILGRPGLPLPLREALGHFVEEEDKHTEMFWRLLEQAEPQWYPTRRPRLFTPHPMYQFLARILVSFPTIFLVWLWLAIFAEERTLFVGREYTRTRRTAPDRVDALHSRVHELHMKDEARHCQLDQHLLTWLYDHEPAWKKRFCGWLFHRIVRSYIFPHRTALRILDVMEREFPRLRGSIAPRLRAELPHVGYNLAFHKKMFSRNAMPRTLALLAEYPEHDRVWSLFLAERKPAS